MKLTIVHGHQEEIKGPVSKFVNVYRRHTGNMNEIYQIKKENIFLPLGKTREITTALPRDCAALSGSGFFLC